MKTFCLLNEEESTSTYTIFRVRATRPAPMIGPPDAANCYLSHVLFLKIDEIRGMKRAVSSGRVART